MERNVGHGAYLLPHYLKMDLSTDQLSCCMKLNPRVKPNSFRFMGVFGVCARITALGRSKHVHGHVLSFGMESDVIMESAIIGIYAECEEMDGALKLFTDMTIKTLMKWNDKWVCPKRKH